MPVIAGARPLPAALRDQFSVVEVFPASGSEADVLLVADVRSGERRVAKLYRKGIAPDFRLLAILAQAVGDTVVRVLAHGVSDGAAYELLEYIPGGTLEDLMRAGPLPKADIKRIVREIADALNGIHAHRILHRDLKPENVLIRSKSPLELALTDFGIASLAAATQHFTSAARTTKYAAPEALTGVLDTKSDWWSLGMIVLEAASGRHPFEGLNEQVMNHHLATRPIDVRGVYDDELRMLCRGLLLRDPNRRWGGDEVARWLAADPTLAVSDAADGVATVVRPYRFGTTEATSSADLALALAKHWDAACRDLARGQITRWLEQELHDYNLVRTLRDIEDQKGVSADGRLLRFLLAAAPDVPPVWRGAPVSEEAVLASARAAANGDDAAQSWLDSLYRDRALQTYVAAGRAELHDLDQRWRRDWDDFVELWQAARDAEEKWRKQPRDVGGGAGAQAVSYDDLAFVASGRLELPPQRMVNAALLLAQADAGYVDALRGEIIGGLAAVSGFCPWFDALWEKAQRHPIGVVVSRQMLNHAQDDAAMEARRQAATSGARAHVFEEARDAMRERLAAVLAFVPNDDEELAAETIHRASRRVQRVPARMSERIARGPCRTRVRCAAPHHRETVRAWTRRAARAGRSGRDRRRQRDLSHAAAAGDRRGHSRRRVVAARAGRDPRGARGGRAGDRLSVVPGLSRDRGGTVEAAAFQFARQDLPAHGRGRARREGECPVRMATTRS